MKNDKDLTEELGHSMPSSKRETEEDMLEELCSLAKKDALIGNKPDDDAHDCHQKQRDQLDDGRCHLEVSRDLR